MAKRTTNQSYGNDSISALKGADRVAASTPCLKFCPTPSTRPGRATAP